MLEVLGILAAIGLVGWLVIITVFALSVAASEYERVEFLGYAAILICVVLYFWQHINVPALMWHNLGTVLTYSIAWLAIGTVWSFWKWDRYCARERVRYDEDRLGNGSLKWEDRLPRALRNKRKFINWIILWPQSAFWYVFSDLIHDLIDVILRQLAHVYDAIARRHFKDLTPSGPTAPTQAELPPIRRRQA